MLAGLASVWCQTSVADAPQRVRGTSDPMSGPNPGSRRGSLAAPGVWPHRRACDASVAPGRVACLTPALDHEAFDHEPWRVGAGCPHRIAIVRPAVDRAGLSASGRDGGSKARRRHRGTGPTGIWPGERAQSGFEARFGGCAWGLAQRRGVRRVDRSGARCLRATRGLRAVFADLEAADPHTRRPGRRGPGAAPGSTSDPRAGRRPRFMRHPLTGPKPRPSPAAARTKGFCPGPGRPGAQPSRCMANRSETSGPIRDRTPADAEPAWRLAEPASGARDRSR
jgi:hypothetical protein